MRLETAHLVLSEYTQKDRNNFYQLKSNPDVWTYSSFVPLESEQEADKLLHSYMENSSEEWLGFKAVHEKETGAFVGEAGILSYNPVANRCEIGYNLLPQYWGRGYATEITRELVGYAFLQKGMERIEALVISDNKASCRVLEKNRFTLDGTLRHFNKCDSGYRDVCVYSILKSDFLDFRRADVKNVETMLSIIHRCMHEVNYKDYTEEEFIRYLNGFTTQWLTNIIETRHYYEVWQDEKLIACGGVSRDLNQEKQSYFTAIFVNPDYRGKGIGRALVSFLEQDQWCLESNLIEIPSSKSSHGFYKKMGYQYRAYPPVFKEEDGSTILYKERE